MGIRAAVYSPAELDSHLRVNPLAEFETVTLTPGIAAPEGSSTGAENPSELLADKKGWRREQCAGDKNTPDLHDHLLSDPADPPS